MTAVLRVGETAYSAKQVTMLCALAKAPMSVDGLNGFDRNCLSKLNDLDLIDLNDTRAAITQEGREVVVALNAKVNGESKAPPEAETKPAKPGRRRNATTSAVAKLKPRRESPPPTGTVDLSTLDILREQIQKRYESDLAAVDRLIEIANAVTA